MTETENDIRQTAPDVTEDDSPIEFMGTISEIAAFLVSQTEIRRSLAIGASTDADGNVDEDMLAAYNDAIDRVVYTMTLEQSQMVARHMARPEFVGRVERIRTGLELYDILAPKVDEDSPSGEDEERSEDDA